MDPEQPQASLSVIFASTSKLHQEQTQSSRIVSRRYESPTATTALAYMVGIRTAREEPFVGFHYCAPSSAAQ